MKYYVGKIVDRMGEYEWETTIRFCTDRNPEAYLDILAMGWRLEDAEWSEEYGGYDHGDGIVVTAGQWKEVSQSTYEGLDGIVTVL